MSMCTSVHYEVGACMYARPVKHLCRHACTSLCYVSFHSYGFLCVDRCLETHKSDPKLCYNRCDFNQGLAL